MVINNRELLEQFLRHWSAAGSNSLIIQLSVKLQSDFCSATILKKW
jgi:hypothetical protein